MEQYFELLLPDGTIRGVLHRPKTDCEELTLMLHGFTGHKGESGFLFVQTARALSKQNIAALRFDFLGSGDSDGQFKDMTFLKELDQARAVFKAVQAWPWVKKINLLGFSMGGALAAKLAGELSQEVNKLLLWAPAGHLNQSVEARFKNHAAEDVLPNGNIDLGGLELGRAFIDEVISLDLMDEVNQYKGPVKLIHGTEDASVALATSYEYVKRYEQATKLCEILGANHTFSSVVWRERVMKETVQFLTPS